MGEGAKYGPTFNGGYYSAGGGGGGGIPSPTVAHKLPRRRQSFCCGPFCILKLLLKLLIIAIIVVGIAALVVWLVMRPSKPKFYVDSVEINNNTSGGSGSNIMLGMSVRNPNKKIGIYYDTLTAITYYGGQSIAATALEGFYQGHKNTTALRPVFNSSVLLSSNSEGVAAVEVKFRSRIRLKVGKIKTRHYKIKVNCRLSVPLSESSSATFSRKKCKVKFDR